MAYKWRRVNEHTANVYVVYWKGGGASGWVAFSKRRMGDRHAAMVRHYYGKNSVKKWICPVPEELTEGFVTTAKDCVESTNIINYLQANFPYCLGED